MMQTYTEVSLQCFLGEMEPKIRSNTIASDFYQCIKYGYILELYVKKLENRGDKEP